ncbi:MAG: EamA family transporter RarD [Campylobacteraceae bacterium]|jgi:chloramphenicol-sensitive protein RarD|nr:EamA family transporter RarD [Campylobacteraceae bacterium]
MKLNFTFSQKNIGIIYAFSAFSLWGILPVYFKSLQHVDPLELIAHRIIWSIALLLVLLYFSHSAKEIKKCFANKKIILSLFVTSILISSNWFTYVWTISNDMVAESSLGYFINPIINIMFGIIFLKEKSSFLEKIAIGIASFAIILEIVNLGKIPYAAFTLAVTFALYGLIRKKINVLSFAGFFIETSLLAPIAICYVAYLIYSGTSTVSLSSDIFLLMLAGPATVVPLLFFTSAASRIKLSTIGFIQYLSPTITFFLAILVYNEPLSNQRVVTFIFIWLSLIFVAIDTIKRSKKRKHI